MGGEALFTYPPLATLKPVIGDIWIVDGPIIRFGPPWPKMPFPTRMTVVRLADGLFIHSPTPLTPSLKAEIERIGAPRWIVGPNRVHYSWLPQWVEAYPSATAYLAPRVREQAGQGFGLAGLPLDTAEGYPWDGELATLSVVGSFMTEVEFFHRATRTLILTDLIENFEAKKIRSPILRFLVRMAGALDPNGGMPRDMRLTFSRRSRKAAVETMISWRPERVLLAHGRWYDGGGEIELRRAFQWLGPFKTP